MRALRKKGDRGAPRQARTDNARDAATKNFAKTHGSCHLRSMRIGRLVWRLDCISRLSNL